MHVRRGYVGHILWKRVDCSLHASSCYMHRIVPDRAGVCSVRSKVVRKSIARVLTVISQNQKLALRESFKGKVSVAVASLPWFT